MDGPAGQHVHYSEYPLPIALWTACGKGAEVVATLSSDAREVTCGSCKATWIVRRELSNAITRDR